MQTGITPYNPISSESKGNTSTNFNATNSMSDILMQMGYGLGTMMNQMLRLPWDDALESRADHSQMAELRSFTQTFAIGATATVTIGLATASMIATSPAVAFAGSIAVLGSKLGIGAAVAKTATSVVSTGIPTIVGLFAGAQFARLFSNSGWNVQDCELMAGEGLHPDTQRIFDKISYVGKLAVYEHDGVVIDPNYLKKLRDFCLVWDVSKSPLEICDLLTPFCKLAPIFTFPTMLFCGVGILFAGVDIYSGWNICSKTVKAGDAVIKPGYFGDEQLRVMASTTQGIFQSKAYLLMDVCSATHHSFKVEDCETLARSVLKTAMGLPQETTEKDLIEAIKNDPLCAYGTLQALSEDHFLRSEGANEMAHALSEKGRDLIKTYTGNNKIPDSGALQQYANERDAITTWVDNNINPCNKGTLEVESEVFSSALNNPRIQHDIIALFLESKLIHVTINNDIILEPSVITLLKAHFSGTVQQFIQNHQALIVKIHTRLRLPRIVDPL